MRGAVEVIWVVFSSIGLVFALASASAAHADFAAASRFRDRNTVEFLFASSVYRSQAMRVAKFITLLTVGVSSIAVPSHYEWRGTLFMLLLTVLPIIITADSILHERSRKRIKAAHLSSNGRRHDDQ